MPYTNEQIHDEVMKALQEPVDNSQKKVYNSDEDPIPVPKDADPEELKPEVKEKVIAKKEEEATREKEKGPKYWTKEEWTDAGKDPGKWKSKDQFDKDGEWISKLEEKSKQIKELQKRLYAQEKERYENKRREVETQYQQAFMNRRVDDFNRAQKELLEMQPPAPLFEEAQVQRSPSLHPEALNFVERNKEWYNTSNPDMMLYANEVDNKFGPQLKAGLHSPEEHMKAVENAVRSKFKDYFDPPEEDDPPVQVQQVESRSTPRSNKITLKHLPSEYRDFYNAVSKHSNVSVEDYYNHLKSQGVLK